MAFVVGDLGKGLRDSLEHTITGLVAVGIVDLLEVVDIDKGDAERLAGGLGGGQFGFERSFKGAAVWQAGEVIHFGLAAGIVEARLQRAGLHFAAAHLLLDLAGALEHDLGDGGELGDDHAGLADLFQLADVGFKCGVVFAGGGSGGHGGIGKIGEAGLEFGHQRVEHGRAFALG